MFKREKQIKNILHKALLLDGEMEYVLYEHELEEHISYWKDGLQKDGEDFVFVITENSGAVAMLLITKNDELFINEKALNKLKLFWENSYIENIQKLLPFMAAEIATGILSVNGVKFNTQP
jgi:hypothetical protein